MIKVSKLLLAVIIFSALGITSCKKNDVCTRSVSAPDTFSTITLSVTEAGTKDETVYKKESSSDTTAIVLKQGKAYDVSVKVSDKSDAIVNIEDAATAYRFYFESSNSSNISVIDLNSDSTHLTVGTTSKWVTEAAGTGNIHIVLKKYLDNKSKAADDNINCSKSSAAIDVLFNTRVI